MDPKTVQEGLRRFANSLVTAMKRLAHGLVWFAGWLLTTLRRIGIWLLRWAFKLVILLLAGLYVYEWVLSFLYSDAIYMPDGSIRYLVTCRKSISDEAYCLRRLGRKCRTQGYTVYNEKDVTLGQKDISENNDQELTAFVKCNAGPHRP